MKSFKMMFVLGCLGLSACGSPPEPEPELPAEPFESEQGQDAVFVPSAAFGPNGHFAMAWAGPNDLHVRRWTGSRWDTLGGALSAFPGETPAFWSAVQVDGQGNPVVAWEERVPGDLLRNSIIVRRWSNGRWAELGGPLNIGPETFDAYKPSLRLDAEGNPIVAWSETASEKQIAVRRWGPSGWQALGPTPVAPGTAWGLELAGNTPILVSQRLLDSGTRAVIEVRRWTGSTWESLGAPLGGRAVAPQVRADAAGNLFLAWLDEGSESPYLSRIRVARWSGTAWEALGADVVVSDASSYLGTPALELDAEGRPLVAWAHAQQTQSLRVARWTGAEWNVKVVEDSTFPGSSSGWVAIAFHPTEGAVVTWVPHETAKLRVVRVLP